MPVPAAPSEDVPAPPTDTTATGDQLLGPPIRTTDDGNATVVEVTQVPAVGPVSESDSGSVAGTPEPATLSLLSLAGIGGLVAARRRK